MKITVEHEIPYDKGLENRCEYAGDFWGNQICKYHVRRNRTHGRKAPPEYRVPKCTLFDKWLDGDCVKCSECLEAVRKAREV